jgi:hypothetical protein
LTPFERQGPIGLWAEAYTEPLRQRRRDLRHPDRPDTANTRHARTVQNQRRVQLGTRRIVTVGSTILSRSEQALMPFPGGKPWLHLDTEGRLGMCAEARKVRCRPHARNAVGRIGGKPLKKIPYLRP